MCDQDLMRILSKPLMIIGMFTILASVVTFMMLLTIGQLELSVSIGSGIALALLGSGLCLTGICFRGTCDPTASQSAPQVMQPQNTTVIYNNYSGANNMTTQSGFVYTGGLGSEPAVTVPQPPQYSASPRKEDQPPSYDVLYGAHPV